MQNKLYEGNFGLESTTKIRNLDSLIVEQKCRMADVSKCENLVENMGIGIFYKKKYNYKI